MRPVDLVFTYVDGADPLHHAKRTRCAGEGGYQPASWFHGVGEITYAVRSALRFAPWLRTIFIVTDEQTPPVDQALLASRRVQVIDHREIIPDSYRPAFDSTVIESHLHRIPGLSEVYLYHNDDFFFGAPVFAEDFIIGRDSTEFSLRLRTMPALLREVIRTASDNLPLLPRANPYTCGISNAVRLLRGAGFAAGEIVVPRHVTQVYRIATAQRVEREFAGPLHKARAVHVKSHSQISWSTLAYSMETRVERARVSSLRDIMTRSRQELFLDFARHWPPGHVARAWRRLDASRAKFICLNNIPAELKPEFEQAMAARELTAAADRLQS